MANRDFTPDSTAHNVLTAKQALAKSDIQHALFHISSALSTDPSNPEWRGILDQCIQRVPDALVFVRTDQEKYDYITAATKGYIHGKRGEIGEALWILASLMHTRPDVPFMLWAREWLQQPGAAAKIPLEDLGKKVIPPILGIVSKMPSPMDAKDECRPSVEAAWDCFAAFHQAYPRDAFILMGASMIGRRLGHFDQAMSLAYQAFQLEPTHMTTVALAGAYRDAKRIDDAVAAFRHALSLKPDDFSPLLDIGDTFLQAERWDDAAAAYSDVLQRQANHPWAEPSLVYAQFRKNPTPEAKAQVKAKLQQLANRSGRAYSLLCEIEPQLNYVNVLPGPGDAMAGAIANVMNHVSQDPARAQGGKVGLNVTHPESPSVLTAFRLWAEAHKYQIGLDLNVQKVQQPDPRVAKGQVDFILWAYDGTKPKPNVPPPDPRAAGAIAEIARMPFDLAAWDGPAKALGAQMGPGWMQHVVCTMVHPPPLPDPKLDPYEWVQKVQIAAALVTGYLDSGWEGSTRKRALFSLAQGPVDWTVDAAIIVLAWLARQDAAIKRDVEQLFASLEKQIPKDGFTCYEYPLACAWLAIPGHDPATEARLAKWKRDIETRAQQPAAPPPEPKHQGLTLQEYAELSVRRDAILMKHAGQSPGAGMALKAMVGGGPMPELEALCREYNLPPQKMSAAAGRIAEWDTQINSNPRVQEAFMRFANEARMRLAGLDVSGNEGRVAEMIRQGSFDVEGAKQNAMAAAEQVRSGQGGEPDPVVFPGQKIERLSHYVALMKGMQTGDMMGALKKAGLDMGGYMSVAQAWGIKLASDPVLNQKFADMMARN